MHRLLFIREDGMCPGVSDEVPDHTNQANQASHEMKPVCVSIWVNSVMGADPG